MLYSGTWKKWLSDIRNIFVSEHGLDNSRITRRYTAESSLLWIYSGTLRFLSCQCWWFSDLHACRFYKHPILTSSHSLLTLSHFQATASELSIPTSQLPWNGHFAPIWSCFFLIWIRLKSVGAAHMSVYDTALSIVVGVLLIPLGSQQISEAILDWYCERCC